MLPDALAEGIRAACGDALLLDARRGRALLADSALLSDVCGKLKRCGFSRLIDFCGTHTAVREDGGDDFALLALLRSPAQAHAALTLKWKYTLAAERPAAHPSLSQLWPNAGLYEREMLEMLGLPFAGNEDLTPLLLDEHMQGHPLRRDYSPPVWPVYASELLRTRHEAGLLGVASSESPVGTGLALSGVGTPLMASAVGASHGSPATQQTEYAPPASRWQAKDDDADRMSALRQAGESNLAPTEVADNASVVPTADAINGVPTVDAGGTPTPPAAGGSP